MKEIILIDENSSAQLSFNQGGEVVVYDQTNSSSSLTRKVDVSHNTKLTWYGVVSDNSDYSLQFVTESGESIVRMLLLATHGEKIKMNLHSSLPHPDTVTNIHILSLVGEEGVIELNGTVQIDSNIAKVKGHILEENIFLGSKGNIRGIPSLLVHSDDVEAGHAARIERVSDEKLYYLRAHGIPKDDATVMMIESAVVRLFEWLEEKYIEWLREQIMRMFS